jgi:hypothetical protein
VAPLEAGQFKTTCESQAVADKPAGEVGGVELGQFGADTLSNVAAHKDELLWLVSAKPTYTVDAMVNVAVPCCVQAAPSAEQYPVNVFPLRTSLTQYGASRLVVLL